MTEEKATALKTPVKIVMACPNCTVPVTQSDHAMESGPDTVVSTGKCGGEMKIEASRFTCPGCRALFWVTVPGQLIRPGSVVPVKNEEKIAGVDEFHTALIEADCELYPSGKFRVNETFFVQTAMRKRGGSFVKTLGQMLLNADDDNSLRIRQTWPEYWNKYGLMGLADFQKEGGA